MDQNTDLAEAIASETARERRAIELLNELMDVVEPLWKFGDGYGGWLREEFDAAAARHGYQVREPRVTPSKKPVVPRWLWKEVMERDEYRCRRCGTHFDLCCDHVIPLSADGPTTLDNLQALCRSCNSRKGARV